MITGPFMGCISVSILLFLKLGPIFDIKTMLYVNDVVSRNPTDCHWFFHVLNVHGKIWTFSPNTLLSLVFGWTSQKRKSERSRKCTIRQKYTAQDEVDGLLSRRGRFWGKLDGLPPKSGRPIVVQTCDYYFGIRFTPWYPPFI